MSTYPYLRAYMAGIVLPTMVMLLVGAVFTATITAPLVMIGEARHGRSIPVFHIQAPIERVILFPMAFIPNLFGLWNMLYIKLQRPHWPIGLHGAVLPLILAPLGFMYGQAVGVVQATPTGFLYFDTYTIPYGTILAVAPLPLLVYYLVWKYIIAFFNRVLGLA